MALAVQETGRLTNLASALGGGVALAPIPGTSVALTGIEILLIGAVAKIWGAPLTGSFPPCVRSAESGPGADGEPHGATMAGWDDQSVM